MNGRRPTMCVTVLQSQPSVSIPTLTMQRTSRPGRVQRPLELLRQLLEPLRDRPAALACPRVHSRLPTVSSVKRIQRDSSLFAPSTSVSPTTFESTRIVAACPSALRSSGMSAGGIPAGRVPSASHS